MGGAAPNISNGLAGVAPLLDVKSGDVTGDAGVHNGDIGGESMAPVLPTKGFEFDIPLYCCGGARGAARESGEMTIGPPFDAFVCIGT